MSYILNALRKSEQERLSQQPSTVTERILVNHPPSGHKASKLLLLLIISNLIVVACFFWFIRKQPGVPVPVDSPKTSTPEKILVKPEIVPPIKILPPPLPPATKKSARITPSIAELATTAKAQDGQLMEVKPVIEKKPVLNQLKNDQIKQEMEPNSIVAEQIETVASVEKNPEAAVEQRPIPFLFELSPGFRQTVPDLKINVFVYSEQPAERFIMVDMVKYTVGQNIKESMKLKEIRSDSLVVDYNNHTFRIKRP